MISISISRISMEIFPLIPHQKQKPFKMHPLKNEIEKMSIEKCFKKKTEKRSERSMRLTNNF